MYIHRVIEDLLRKASENFACITIYGPRQVGKSTTAYKFFGQTFIQVNLDNFEDRYENIPNQLKDKNLRFHIIEFSKNPSRDRILDVFVWLRKAGVAIPVYRSSSFEHRLRISLERSALKLFLMDVGMLTTSISDCSLQKKLSMRKEEENTGAIIENYVAQELSAHGLEDLYFYHDKKLEEAAFAVENGADILPIEVKSESDFRVHKALENLLNHSPSIPTAHVFFPSNAQGNGRVLSPDLST